MAWFRRDTYEERIAKVHAERDIRIASDIKWRAQRQIEQELRAERVAEEVKRLRAEMGLPDPTAPVIVAPVAEIATPDPAPVKVPKVRKVSPAPVEAPLPPAPASEEVAQAAPVAASPAIASDAQIAPKPRTRKVRTVAAKVATPETVTVPMPVTVREPCGVDPVTRVKKGGKCEALGIKFK